jgi:hypothetical protein
LGDAGEELYNYIWKLDPQFIYDHHTEDAVLSIQYTSDPLPAQDIADSALNRWMEEWENSDE